jgi:hypothetical protein
MERYDPNLMLWCRCADAFACGEWYGPVCRGALATPAARYAKSVAHVAYLSSTGNPQPFQELTRAIFLLGACPTGSNDPAVAALRTELEKREVPVLDANEVPDDAEVARGVTPDNALAVSGYTRKPTTTTSKDAKLRSPRRCQNGRGKTAIPKNGAPWMNSSRNSR